MKTFFQFLIVIAFSAILFVACDKGEEEVIVPVYLEDFNEYTSSKSLTATDIKGYLEQDGLTELAALAAYDIKIYKLEYKTAFEGDSVIASGLVVVPVPIGKKDAFPILSYQHEVLVSNSNAPTVNPQGEDTELATFIASTGFIVFIPDYIGFGASNEYFHPFLHKTYTTNSVLDFIRASKEFIAIEKPCKSNGNIFLLGFGQGAGATLAALSAIETDSVKNNDIAIKASACASGIYNLIEFREWLVNQIKFEQPWYLAYLLESFKHYAGLVIEDSLVFNQPFASLIPGMIDGTRTGDQMNDLFGTKSLDELLNDNFRDDEIFNSESDTTYAGLRQVLINNSIQAWNLKSPINFYYGKSDTWIPVDQSLYIFNDFKNLGVSSNLKIDGLDDLDHETAVIPSLIKSVIWFRTF